MFQLYEQHDKSYWTACFNAFHHVLIKKAFNCIKVQMFKTLTMYLATTFVTSYFKTIITSKLYAANKLSDYSTFLELLFLSSVFYNVIVSNYWGNLWVESLDTVVQHSGEKLNVPRAGPLPTAFWGFPSDYLKWSKSEIQNSRSAILNSKSVIQKKKFNIFYTYILLCNAETNIGPTEF